MPDPEDFDDEQTSEDSKSELDTFLGVVDDDSDDDPDDLAGITSRLASVATAMGVDPGEYENDDDLEAAINTRIAKTNAGTLDPIEEKETTLAAVKFALEGDALRDVDKGLRDALEGVVSGTNAQLDDLRKLLKSNSDIHPDVVHQLQALNRVVTSLDDDRVQVRLRAWSREGPKRIQEFFGTKATGALDYDGIQARHRRVLTKKAVALVHTAHKGGRRYTLEGLFSQAARSMKGLRPAPQKVKVEDDADSGQSGVEGTATARQSGLRGNQFGAGTGNLAADAAAIQLRAENVIAKAQRKAARS